MFIGFFAGRLGADPEERFTSKGRRVIVLRVAVNYRNSSSSKDDTMWCKCNIWHDRYDKMLPYLKKGSAVMFNGDVVVESYMGKDGVPHSSVSVSIDSLKFSPFGKSDKFGAESGVTVDKSMFDGMDDSSEMAFASNAGDSDFMSDDMPF